jgi:DNA transposition AAA+ family ATPase
MSEINEKNDAQRNLGNTVRASWNFSLDAVRQNIAYMAAREQEALVSALLWCNDTLHPLTKPDFAKRVKCSDNLLYKLYTGTYKNEAGERLHPAEDLVSNIENFLAIEKERYLAGETQFVLTPTAKRIVTACDLARESQTIVFIVGPSHIGKTWTTQRHYTPSNNHGRTVYVRMQAASGLGGMVRAIAAELKISVNSNTPDLIRRIKDALTKDMLLIIDEVHLLAHTYRAGSFHNCMEVLRELHDVTKCGMVLIFTILDAVRAASQKELQQVWRRGVHKVILPKAPTPGDVEAILKHNKLEMPAKDLEITVGKITDRPYDVVRQLASSEGLLSITERIRYARKLANKAMEKLKWEHFVHAHLLIAKNAELQGEWN